MKYYGKFLFLLCVVGSLAACQMSDFKHNPAARLPSRQQLCSHLRQQIIFQNTPPGPNMIRGTPIRQAHSLQQYERYNCTEFDYNTFPVSH